MKRLGAAALVVAVPAVGVALAWCAKRGVDDATSGSWAPDQIVAIAVAIAGAAAAAHLTVTGVVFAIGEGARTRRGTFAHCSPRAWRAILALALGLGASASGAATAMAASPDWGAGTEPGAADAMAVSPDWGAGTEPGAELAASSSSGPIPTPDATEGAAPPPDDPIPWSAGWGATAPENSAVASPVAVASSDPVAVAPPIESTSAATATPPTSPAPATQTPGAVTTAPGAKATYVVVPGDSLWRIAKGFLPPGASDAEITRTWQAIYRANRDTVGADPGLIFPGQVLALPLEVRS